MNVPGKLFRVFIRIHQNSLEPPLKKMARPLVLKIKIDGIRTDNVSHHLGKISPGGLQEKMDMVAHQAIAMNHRSIALESGIQIR
jgi:hypothetical protein